MQFSLPHFLIFSQTGLHSQRQPGTSLLAQLVIDEVESVKNKQLDWQLIFKGKSFKKKQKKNNLTLRSHLPGHYINIFSESKNLGKCDKLLHTLYLNKKRFFKFSYISNFKHNQQIMFISIPPFLICMHTFWYQINITCSKAVVDSKLLAHIQEHCHTVQTMVLPPIYNSWGQQTAL